ncbi:MAG: drug/metabolite exporter YedA [Myxococcaceae bacterium]|jgi:drug/metabolite transporter (DMT)-like permease|nr:drug/metabolite exporter YedA [Myxococcaceae bacterium]
MAPSAARWVVPALAAVYLVWGSTYLAMRVVVEVLPPFAMAAARYLSVGLVLLVFLTARGAAWPTGRQWLLSVPIGGLMFLLGNGTVAFAEKHLSSGIAAVVCGTMPLWVAALGPLFGERATVREWVGLGLGFAGVAVLGLGRELRAEPLHAAVLLIAPIAWAAGSMLSRAWPMPKGLMSAATQMIAGGALMGLVSLALGEQVPTVIPLKVTLSWLYLCVFGSLVAYSAYTYLLGATRPAIATSYSYVNPVIAVLMGALLGGEAVGPEVIVAVLLIVSATAMVVVRRTPSSAATPEPRPAASES